MARCLAAIVLASPGVYNHATYLKEMREALERRTDHLDGNQSEPRMERTSGAVLGNDAAWTRFLSIPRLAKSELRPVGR